MESFNINTKISFGDNALDRLISIPYKKVLVVSDPFAAKSGLIKHITDRLDRGGIDYKLFTDVVPDPPISKISLGVKMMSKYRPEAIIAIGGGSAIDSAKAINKVFSQIEKIHTVPMIAIPTTSGTGSEVTSFAVISDPEENCKYPLINDDMLPAEAILDVDMVKSVPASITANTGMDVLTHAIEAYVSVNHNDFSDALAEKAIELCGQYLLRSFGSSKDVVARSKMHSASCLAGLAFNCVSLGVNHGMAHAIGAHFHIPHGQANAMLLPRVVEYNSGIYSSCKSDSEYNDCALRYADVAKILGLCTSGTIAAVRALVSWIEFMLNSLNIPTAISQCSVSREEYFSQIDVMAQNALEDACTATNPIVPKHEDIVKILENLY